MVKEIAVYVNSLGKAADFDESGVIKVFAKDKDQWKAVRELSFEFNGVKESKDLINIAEALENCKIFVAGKFSDLAHMIFDSMGFSTWKMDGNPTKFLDYILEKEEEEAEVIKFIDHSTITDRKQSIIPIEIGDSGCYILSFKELQEHNMGRSSKQVLRPFLNNKKFNELIITCSHIPNWLQSDLEKLNLNFQFLRIEEDDYMMVINKK